MVGFIKPKLPGPLAGHLDSMLAGGSPGGMLGGSGGMLGGLTGGLGGGGQATPAEPATGEDAAGPSAAASVEGALGGLFGK